LGKITGKKPLLIPEHVERLFKHREYDIQKTLNTGWKPKYSTREALEKTYRELVAKGMMKEN
jgi:nucleoside-diphosphate-sugar epimerase